MNAPIDSYTNIGGRPDNEDSCQVCKSSNGILLIVADGLGGHDCGEIASTLAVETLAMSFQKEKFDLESSIQLANKKIMEKQNEMGLKMKTTISAAWISYDATTFAHVGDSRIYAFLFDKIVFQSMDHSLSQMAVLVGEITAGQIRNHPDRNILTRALGVTESVKIDVSRLNNGEYDSLLLCTDGFWEYVYEKEMIQYKLSSKQPDEWINKMREVLTKRISSNNDNHTAIAMLK